MSIPLADTESPPAPPTTMLIDVALQLGMYFSLRYLVGTSQLVAVIAAACVVVSAIAVRSARRRSVDPLELLTLALLACSILVAAITGNPRVILLMGSAIGILMFGVITGGVLMGNRAVATLMMRLTVRGDPSRAHAWNQRVTSSPSSIRAIRTVDPVWMAAVALSSVTSLIGALALPIDYAVVAGQLIPFVVAIPVIAITALVLRPVRAALAAPGAPPTPVHLTTSPRSPSVERIN